MPQDHPIIALWSHPRSMSTATERIMRERGDCRCFHEPFMYDYYANRSGRPMPMMEGGDDRPRTYAGVCASLREAAESGPVFFKDMSYYVVPQIFADPAFSRRLVNTFLIRDPLRSIVSYYKLDPDVTMAEIGIYAQWQHVRHLRNELGLPVTVIEAETISENPRGMMAAYWRAIGFGFVSHAFDWQPVTPEDWRPVAGWHQNVSRSVGIRPQPSREAAEAAFETAAQQAPHLRDYLALHRPAYEHLRSLALTAIDPDEGPGGV